MPDSETTGEPIARLARALMNLRGETLGTVNQAIGINRSNLSGWLRGMPQRLSKEREADLMYHLGVERGRLRRDMVHKWEEASPFMNLLTVLDFDDGSGAGSLAGGMVLCDSEDAESIAGSAARWKLLLPETVVRFTEPPAAERGPSLIEALGGRVISREEGSGCDFASVMRQMPAWSSREDACEVLLRHALMGLVDQASDGYRMAGKAMWMMHADLIVEAIRNERAPGQIYATPEEGAKE